MNALTPDDFIQYFLELHGVQPYAWQTELAQRAIQGEWPKIIDLPTGSGKTSCLDIALFGLAAQARMPAAERTAPRRFFFCVNRRVIVDEAHNRAVRIQSALMRAEQSPKEKPVLARVAQELRRLSATNSAERVANDGSPPVDVIELRGGIYRDNRWARTTTQPAIVCTTVDQLGSRLLFRGYGVSTNAAPIQAALIAYDSLIFLDEAHISNPFLQTLERVADHLDPERWAEENIGLRPMTVVAMTATPPEQKPGDGKTADVFRLSAEDRNSPPLSRRLSASKPARLELVNDVVRAAVTSARDRAAQGPAAIGIFVNRVATARDIYKQLRSHFPNDFVELVIGSMRPIDRDKQADRFGAVIGKGRPELSAQTSFIVATQCLEVGADYDFDFLISECAAFDALRQRFGRLNRNGRAMQAAGVILMDAKTARPDEKLDDTKPIDRVYGNAACRTWNWLNEHAAVPRSNGSATDGLIVDFGINSMNTLAAPMLRDTKKRTGLQSPSASLEAPKILPAYIDLWCQTSPRPEPEPDLSLFLHGKSGVREDVQICWRADLAYLSNGTPDTENWCDVVSLLPPTAAECISVPIDRVRKWLAGEGRVKSAFDIDSDLLTAPVLSADESERDERGAASDGSARSARIGVLWRGIENSAVFESAADLRPGDTLVLPVQVGGWESLGHIPAQDSQSAHIDIGDDAFLRAKDRAALRLYPGLKYAEQPAFKHLIGPAGDEGRKIDSSELRELLSEASGEFTASDPELAELTAELARDGNLMVQEYPDGRGLVLMARQRRNRGPELAATLDDGDDVLSHTHRSRPVSLAHHSVHVATMLEADAALLPLETKRPALVLAAELHDLGKADERFQALLRGGRRNDAYLWQAGDDAILAKSGALPTSRSEREQARRRADLPRGFRHEMLSVQLAERSDRLPADPKDRDLVLHLIAAHHGFARPFAPVTLDATPPDVRLGQVTLTGPERRAAPPDRIDSGIAERFWTQTRRFGWWGLAYLEACLRLADQQASQKEAEGFFDGSEQARSYAEFASAKARAPVVYHELHLPGLDGANPLGFLAALGLFRVLETHWNERNWRLQWTAWQSTWSATLKYSAALPLERGDLLERLYASLKANSEEHPMARIVDLKANRDLLLSEALEQADYRNRLESDWLAALFADQIAVGAINQLQTVRRDYLPGNLASILRNTEPQHLERALFQAWDYGDALDNQSMHWDPGEDRRHALQWNQPSGDPERKMSGGMLGANRLAIEAVPLFTSVHFRDSLRTLGFTGHSSRKTRWSWPIWTLPIRLIALGSLLAHPDIQKEEIDSADRARLRAMGISAILRSRRILVGKTPNLTPARQIA